MHNLPRAVLLLNVLLPALWAADRSYDVVVYGGTAGGAMAAVAAAGEGAQVVLVEPGGHVGGMLSGGLGRTDMVRQENVIGGYAREFFVRAGSHYSQPIAWTFEPGVAERILREWLQTARVTVFFQQRIESVSKQGNRITAMRTSGGDVFLSRVFIDSSYEGDLMKAAGVAYTVGRESRRRYDESLAGRQDFLPGKHQFRVGVPAMNARGELPPYVQRQSSLEDTGEGSGKFQSYCFRICLTRNPANRLPIPKPADYDAERYALVLRQVEALGAEAKLRDFIGISVLPNDKCDINSGGPVSTNLPGASWDYPEADHQRREQIRRAHLSWAQGLLWLLGNEPAVPEAVRKEMNQWGLAKDEFVDTGHWPHQLYVREGRRMLGEYVLTQKDLQQYRRKYDSIGMAGYNIDIREVQWVAHDVYHFPTMRQEVLVEGYVSVPVEPWEIPYRALLPREQEAGNLLVTACISASTIAYASFRMEPQYMIAGHSAGVAAALAAWTGRSVQSVDLARLQERLRAQGQILHLE
jgi:hypothetical protein